MKPFWCILRLNAKAEPESGRAGVVQLDVAATGFESEAAAVAEATAKADLMHGVRFLVVEAKYLIFSKVDISVVTVEAKG